MSESSLERLFTRYAARGDVRALGEVFDRAGPELLVIAAHLARDAAEAEDLLQATFLAAIEGARKFDPRRPLMPWLVGILTRQARYQHRRAARRVEPEQLEPPRIADPGERTEAEEVRTSVSRALRSLPDLYQDVLAAYLTGGQKPREIARELGRAPGTVRVQIHRGLELLRQALPAGFALGAAATLLPTRGLAAVRAAVVASGAKAAATGGGVVSASAVLGGLTMSARSVSIASLLVLAVGASWFTWDRLAPPPLEDDASFAPPTLTVEVSAADEATLEAAPATRTQPVPTNAANAVAAPTPAAAGSDAADAEVALPSFVVRGFLKGLDVTHSGVATITARVRPRRLGWNREQASPATPVAPRQIPALPDGSFEIDVTGLLRPEDAFVNELAIEADHPAYLVGAAVVPSLNRFRADGDRRVHDVEIQLRPPACLVVGQTRSSGGILDFALFTVDPESGAPGIEPVDQWTSRDGAFALRAREPGEHIVAAAHPERPAAFVRVTVEAAPSQEVTGLEVHGGTSIWGTLRFPPGLSPEGATVVATPVPQPGFFDVAWKGQIWNGEWFDQREATAAADEFGRFSLLGVREWTYDVGVRAAVDLPRGGEGGIERVEAPAADVQVLPAVAVVRFLVLSPDGPVAGARVRAYGPGESRAATTGDDGKAELVLASRIKHRVEIEAAGFEALPETVRAPGPGQDLVKVFTLRAAPPGDARLVLRVDGPDPPSALRVESVAGASRSIRTVAGSKGTYELEGLAARSTEFRVRPAATDSYALEARFTVALASGKSIERELAFETGGRLRLRFTERVPAWAQCRVRRVDKGGEQPGALVFVPCGLDGAGRPDAIRAAHPRDVKWAVDLPAERILACHPPLAPGTYRIEVQAHELDAQWSTEIEIRGGAATEAHVALRATGRIWRQHR